MRVLAAIRTNKWTEEEDRLLAALRAGFGNDVVVVFHDRGPQVEPPLPVVDLNTEWVLRNRLPLVPDWGWRCGDYFYYALRAARPDCDAYWLVEPDVHFTGDAAGFFSQFAMANEDALGYQLGPFAQDIRFTRGLPGMAHHRAIFALTRFTGRTLDRLMTLRQAMSDAAVNLRDYPNDEIFSFTQVAAMPDMVWGRLEDYAPGWFEGTQFAPDPDMMFDAVIGNALAGRVMHPVRSRAAFKRALGRRLAGNTGILVRMRAAIDLLTTEEIEEVAQIAADQVRSAITQVRDQREARRRRRAGGGS